MYISQLPWIIEKFAIYEKTFILGTHAFEPFPSRKLTVRMELWYELKRNKRKRSEMYLIWVAESIINWFNGLKIKYRGRRGLKKLRMRNRRLFRLFYLIIIS